MDQPPPIAPVLRSQVSDEEIARRIEVVQRERPAPATEPAPEPTLADFTAKVNRLYNRQAIAALVTASGQCFGVRIPPRPMILQQAEQVFEEETGVKQ